MDAFENSRQLTGIWVNGTRIGSDRVALCETPIKVETAAEIRIGKDILRHELEAAHVMLGDDLLGFVQADLRGFGVKAFGAYLTIASAARLDRPKSGFLKRLLGRRKRPAPEWLLRVSEDVCEADQVIVIRTVAGRARAEQ